MCARAYREERKKIIEDEVLPDYDVPTYAEYIALKANDPTLFDAIGTKISEAEEGWNLLFCGFDNKRAPHLFVISGNGKIQYCDTPGFAAIGSGGWAAHVALASYPYTIYLDREEAAYCLLAAKFAAESAQGVGRDTVLHVLTPGNPYSTFLLNVDNIREQWKALPRIPDGAASEIKTELNKFEGVMKTPKKRLRRLLALAEKQSEPETTTLSPEAANALGED